ncbi:MAG: DUF2380 domain-containing protein [Archangium sp.]
MGRMNILLSRRGFALLCLLLSACASSTSTVREDDETSEAVSSWAEAQADPSCVVPRCDEERCAVWRCQDLVAEDAPPVLLAQATIPELEPVPEPMLRTLPAPEQIPSRWWGHPTSPMGTEPIFEIPWSWCPTIVTEEGGKEFTHALLHCRRGQVLGLHGYR